MTIYSTEVHYGNGSASSFEAQFYGVIFMEQLKLSKISI
jgi:hypothetical protein